MKRVKYLLTAGFLLSVFPISAENSLFQEDISPSELWYEEEESSLTTLEQELSLLDKEFTEFNQEIFSLEEPEKSPVVQTTEIQQEPSFLEKTSGWVSTESETSSPIQSTSLPVEATPLSLNASAVQETQIQLPEIAFEAPSPPSFTKAVELESASKPVEIATVTEESPREIIFEQTQESHSLPGLVSIAEPQEVIPLEEPAATLNVEEMRYIGEPTLHPEAMTVDLKQAFNGSPLIYSLLLVLSIAALTIWLYVSLTLNQLTKAPQKLSQALQNKLTSNHFEEALALCQNSDHLLSKMIISGIHSRKHGFSVMVDAMKVEGKRASMGFWQKIGMLNDIAIIAPMFGLLGTVLGMFYAFYHINRSVESISTLFDGLGVSVGTTVAGLIVAILALILHSIAKYKLVRALAIVENEAHSLAHLIDDRTTLSTRG